MTLWHNFTRIKSLGRPWILTVCIGRLQVRIGNYQRAIWWLKADGQSREIYNSWKASQ